MVSSSPFPTIYAVPRRCPRRHGFSLLELTLVIAVLSILVAITWPSLSRPLSRSEVQAAAQRLQQDLLELRLRAMASGRAHSLLWEVGGDRYWTGPTAILQSAPFTLRTTVSRDTDTGESGGGVSGNSDGGQDEGWGSESSGDLTAANPPLQGTRAPNDGKALKIQACTLPGNVVFAAAINSTSSNPRGARRGSRSEEDDLPDEAVDDKTNDVWAPPITCQPTGRFRSSSVQLRSESGYEVTVHIEGLTGRVRVGTVQRISRSSAESLPEDSAIDEPSTNGERFSSSRNSVDSAVGESP